MILWLLEFISKGAFQDFDLLKRIIPKACQKISEDVIENMLGEFSERTNKCIGCIGDGGYIEALLH